MTTTLTRETGGPSHSNAHAGKIEMQWLGTIATSISLIKKKHNYIWRWTQSDVLVCVILIDFRLYFLRTCLPDMLWSQVVWLGALERGTSHLLPASKILKIGLLVLILQHETCSRDKWKNIESHWNYYRICYTNEKKVVFFETLYFLHMRSQAKLGPI